MLNLLACRQRRGLSRFGKEAKGDSSAQVSGELGESQTAAPEYHVQVLFEPMNSLSCWQALSSPGTLTWLSCSSAPLTWQSCSSPADDVRPSAMSVPGIWAEWGVGPAAVIAVGC